MSKIELIHGSCADQTADVKLCAFGQSEMTLAQEEFESGSK